MPVKNLVAVYFRAASFPESVSLTSVISTLFSSVSRSGSNPPGGSLRVAGRTNMNQYLQQA